MKDSRTEIENSTPATVEGWLRRWGGHPLGPLLLCLLAVVEATVFPAPTEAMLLALSVASPRRTPGWIALATAASVGGGLVGYAAGAGLTQAYSGGGLGGAGSGEWMDRVAEMYRSNHALALATSGFTPVPYLVYTSAAGATGVPLGSFVAFSLVGRALKFCVVAGAGMVVGPALVRAVDRLGRWGAAAAALVLVAAYLVLRR